MSRARSANRTSRTSTPQFSPPSFHKPTLSQSEINELSEREKRKEYDEYKTTGDFKKDFSYLCQLVGMKLTVSHRSKIPNHPTTPNTPPITGDLFTARQTSLLQAISDNFRSDSPQPRTYSVSTNNYEYFKPHVEIDTVFDYATEYVKDLYLNGWKVDMRVINVLCRTLPELERLTVLNMGNAGLVDDSLYCLGQCLALSPSLKTLCLDGNNFVVSQRFDVFLTQNTYTKKPCLQNLSLRSCNLNENGALLLGDSLTENKSLLTLNLCFNNISDKGAQHLASALRTNRTLLSLDIGSNCISDSGVKHIAETISTFPLTHEEIVTRRLQQSLLNKQRKEMSDIAQTALSPTSTKGSRRKSGLSKSRRGKGNWDKLKNATGLGTLNEVEGRTQTEDDSSKDKHPLLEKVQLKNGEPWITGNRTLINLNLSRNKIGDNGVQLLYVAVKHQQDVARDTNRNTGVGLMRLSLQKNLFPQEDITYAALLDILKSRDPLKD